MNYCNKYESDFNQKIDSFKEHKQYKWLREYANEAIRYHTGHSYLQIKASDLMDRIIAMPVEYIRDWLDDKNKLEWKDYKKKENK